MKKILFTSLFVFGLLLSVNSIDAMGASGSSINYDEKVVVLQSSPTLRRGMKNDYVYKLQLKLKELGYYTKSVDSDYGSGTLAAVTAFQRAKGLYPDGVVGPKTLGQILGTTVSTTKPVTSGIVKPTICTADYSPVCGLRKPLPYEKVTQAGLMKTYSNKCNLKAAGATYLYDGKCKTTKPIETIPTDDWVSGGHEIPGWDDFNECLSVEPYGWNNTDYSRGQISKKIASYKVENNCHDHVYLNNIEFYISTDTQNIPFSEVYAEIGDENYDVEVGNINSTTVTRRGDLTLEGLDSNPFAVEEGEEYELSLYADISGAYSPWNNSDHKTISVIAFNEMDFESEDGEDGINYNFDIKEIWSELVTIKH